MQKDRELRKVPRACQSTGRAGEAEWPLQIPEAIGVELVCQASLADTGTSGAFDNPSPPTRQGVLAGSATHYQGRRGREQRSSLTTSNAPGGTGASSRGWSRALSYMSVFHPKPIYEDAACWRGVPLLRG